MSTPSTLRKGLHIPAAFEGVGLATWFKPIPANLNYQKELPPNFFEQCERAASPEAAAAIVLPNNFKSLTPAAEAYITQWADTGEKFGIPVYVFSLGDFTDGVLFDARVRVFRLSIYRSARQPHDIVIPALTEDNAKDGIELRLKHETPVVSFCGMGDFATVRGRLAYHAKNLYWRLRGIVQPAERARMLGVYWRRAMMSACAHSASVATQFIVRKTFSGNRTTIELDPAVARREYLDSIRNADFVLAPKGDGNYSNRLYKTLCLGRIPVVVDTDMTLPFEDEIDYARIMVRVPMSEVGKTPEYVRAFYDALDEKEWHERQQEARRIFETRLRQDAYFAHYFAPFL